jgi:hypothetical protein
MVDINYPLKDSPWPFALLIGGVFLLFMWLFTVEYFEFWASLGFCLLSSLLLIIGIILLYIKEGKIGLFDELFKKE